MTTILKIDYFLILPSSLTVWFEILRGTSDHAAYSDVDIMTSSIAVIGTILKTDI